MRLVIVLALVLLMWQGQAQSIIGSWQLTNEKTCFQSGIKESETEKELLKDMGGSSNGVARIIRFNKKGTGDDGVFSTGMKKGANMSSFKFTIKDQQLMLLDAKSGIMTQQLIIDELTGTTLRLHNAQRDCETKTFVRIK